MSTWIKRYYLSEKWRTVSTYKNIPQPPSVPCVYIIFIENWSGFTREVQYIGQTSNLYKRLSSHIVYSKVRKIIYDKRFSIDVKIKYIESKKKRELLEKKLIQKLKPPFNKMYNWGYL